MKILLVLICLTNLLFAEVSKEFYDGIIKSEKLLDESKINEAIKEAEKLQNIAKSKKEKEYILQFLANVYLESKNYKKASMYLLNVLDFKEDKSKIYKSLSYCFYNQKEYEKAKKYAKEYLKSDRNNKGILKLLYVLSYKTKNYKKAIYYFKVLHEGKAKNEEYYLGLVGLLMEAKLQKKALSLLDYAYKKGALKSKNAINTYLYVLQSNVLYKKAANVLKERRSYFKDYSNRHLNFLLRAKDYKGMADFVKNNSKATDKNRFLLAKVHFSNQEFQKSIRCIKKLKFKQNSKMIGEALMLKAYNYYYLKDEKALINALKEALNNKYSEKRAKGMLARLDSI